MVLIHSQVSTAEPDTFVVFYYYYILGLLLFVVFVSHWSGSKRGRVLTIDESDLYSLFNKANNKNNNNNNNNHLDFIKKPSNNPVAQMNKDSHNDALDGVDAR